jgi:FHA domain/Protein kinase domain
MQLVLRALWVDPPGPRLRLGPGQYVFGRAPKCDVRVPFRSVSRKHFILSVGSDSATVRDLNSRCGTEVNGRRVAAEERLRTGDRLSLAGWKLCVQLLSDDADPSPDCLEVQAGGEGVTLEGLVSAGPPADRAGNLVTVGDGRPGKLAAGLYEVPLNIPDYDLKLTIDLLNPLGHGDIGEVWWVKTRGTGDWHEGALKVTHDPEGTERAWRARCGATRLIPVPPHPHLLTPMFLGSFLGRFSVKTEVADGSLADLADALPRADCKPRLIAALGDAATGLDRLHEHGLVHGCPKPRDILLFRGRARVGDFDLIHDPRDAIEVASVARFADPGYLAPEVWAGRSSGRSDQYALACGYAYLRTGRRVFPIWERADWERCHREADPDLSGLADRERAAVRRALCKDPEQRYGTCAEFAAAVAAGT